MAEGRELERLELGDEELKLLVATSIHEQNKEDKKEGRINRPGIAWNKLKESLKSVRNTAKRERKETAIAIKILRRYLLYKEISEEEKKFLKEQSIDIARLLPLVAVQAIPVPVPITPLLIGLGKKIGIDLIPKEQKLPGNSSQTNVEEKEKD